MADLRKSGLAVGAAVLSAALLSGCLQSEEGGGGGGAPEDTAEGDGQIQILGSFPAPESDGFEAALADFEAQSGIEVTYVPSTDFTTEIRTRVQGGNPPDIALFPQPGLVNELGESGDLLPLNDLVDVGSIEQTLIPGFLDAVTAENGDVYAAPMRMAVKSITWYPTPAFEEAGYTAPTTWSEMVDLTAQMREDGNTPWCIGAEAGADTGWVLTDWVEEMVLRTAGPEVYDQWTSHEIPFNDPQIIAAAQRFADDIAFTEGNVAGGRQAILTTPFDVSPNGMFDEPPTCYLHRQGSFVTSFFPDEVQSDLAANVGTFVFPPIEDGYDGTPILGSGDMAAAFVNDSDVVELMEFMSSAEFGGPWAEAGGWLSPHATFDNSLYADDSTREIAALAQEGDVFRFDGSDLMPAEVGAGTFWDETVAWVGGEKDLEAAFTAIEESWPE
ncbi:extracellular solute-binding protein [Desertihabitans brevis]|uniref:Extracellular solute-binding protein n=1 Tax=Desertihabitans brevis TaxID=2268447 RepID=A0A367YTE7_9ACTN|nr:extracellular solute-binding protein [Desertihabitans brevis]RCK69088.1 extracellular solute-binding protein [Desertihabitans brevis]